jgi:large subunit ribosomal protein L10
MAVTRQVKEDALKVLVDKFGRSKSVVFANYRGLDVASISEIRNQLRKEDAEMKVAKKTLMNIAAKDLVGELDKTMMDGPVVATFSYNDPLAGIRILFKFSKKNDKLKLLGGIVDGKAVGADIIQQYAKLPSKQELLAKLLGSMNAPVSNFVGVCNSLVAGIVRVLNAYKDKMPAAPAPAAEVAPAPAPAVEEKKEGEVA